MSFCLPREYEIPAVCNRISSKLSCRSAYCPATGAAPPAVPLTFAFASGAFAEWILVANKNEQLPTPSANYAPHGGKQRTVKPADSPRHR